MRIFVIFFILLCATPLTDPSFGQRYFVVWNVGQGQWTTWVEPGRCLHFDMGGEFFPERRIERACAGKENFVFLSHWDWDHVGLLGKARRFLKKICLARGPLGRSSRRKELLLPPPCTHSPSLQGMWIPAWAKNKKTNDLSQVFIENDFLIPGDSPQKAEKIWAAELPLQNARFLILGHHGSKTSTSEFLLRRLPRLRIAVSSARWGKYHHPHAETIHRLNKFRTPLLRTEDWGSIGFEF
jgi:competence protein ComEC